MQVKSVMTQNILSVQMDDSIGKIREILKAAKFHHLFVVENKRLVGIISDRDMLRAISPFLNTLQETRRDLTVLDRRVHQIMSRKLVTVDRHTSIETAMKLLLDKNISCLPVVSPDGEIEGIVTWRDIIRAYLQIPK
ncbi:MAG: CBS domain-containing protein [Lentisphaerae bacterium RIFOXYA12_FULL_48_11]|nr:MAG: CBS domain-containing protein [Lentisphaerae bacterium RIFOXYA12_FULL_48_11]